MLLINFRKMGERMPPVQNKASNPESMNIFKRAKTFLLVIILLAVAVGGLYLLQNHFVNPYKFKYTTTSNYVLSIRPQGQGISFDQPAQFKEVSKDNDQVENQHYIKVDGREYFIGYIAAIRSYLPESLSDTDLATMDTTLSSPTSKDYPKTVTNFQKFVSDRIPVNWTAKFNAVTKFTNKSISKNAWSMEFTATGKNSNPKGSKLVKGKAVMVVTNYFTYYFVVYTVDYNWQSNMSTWNKTFNSLMVGI